MPADAGRPTARFVVGRGWVCEQCHEVLPPTPRAGHWDRKAERFTCALDSSITEGTTP